jgi:hypothetical protein
LQKVFGKVMKKMNDRNSTEVQKVFWKSYEKEE